jgi:hypothetical protein
VCFSLASLSDLWRGGPLDLVSSVISYARRELGLGFAASNSVHVFFLAYCLLCEIVSYRCVIKLGIGSLRKSDAVMLASGLCSAKC